MPLLHATRRGFTLIEMLIVGSLIVLFAGLAMIGAQQMYDSNKKKAVQDEVKSIATALSAAKQDIGFYPRIYLLGMPFDQVCFPKTVTGNSDPASTANALLTYYTRPAMDTYGYFGYSNLQTPNCVYQVATSKGWRAPYMSITEARKANTSGGRKAGLVRVRLMEPNYTYFDRRYTGGEDPSLVFWPADPWGNPYVVYHISVDLTDYGNGTTYYDPANNPKGMRLILNPMEEGNYINAVVSYGPNRLPGGNDKQGTGNPANYNGWPGFELFVKGDLGGTGADFTLKSPNATGAAKLDTTIAGMAALAQSLESKTAGRIGVFNDGSDDIFYKF